jgi:multifunctional beta-oxidation protein
VYANFFASRGAAVVVNDLGVSTTGSGSSSNAADVVVNEIRQAGGKAVANYNSVEEGEAIVETALKAFGRIDIVVNNAGILRDKGLNRMSDEDWDLVHQVHVRGSYKVTKAAWPHMQKQKYGRIIMTASAAGIYGNHGQTNYSSAKLALHGFALSLAREGAKYNIQCNSIAPIAASRMTATILPPEVLNALKPEFVAPLVGYLSHESSTENGSIFEVGAGFVAKLRRERSKGVVFKTDKSFTPSAVAAKFDEIINFKDPDYPSSITETDWMSLLEKAKSLSHNVNVQPPLRYDGRVVLVTGAGAGIGRAYALLFASLGAKVVVNDLGGSAKGVGNNSKAADIVVDEIRRSGGTAVANYDSVEDGEKLVDTAIKAFGRIDVIVNNAGILRDKSFVRMTDADWDLIMRVHLRGCYKIIKAAWPHMLKQKYGRIINTSSAVGLYGNFGQTNYAAAKSGIIGLSNSLAIEGKKSNIICNTIAPNAGTRMTATILPPEMVEALKPEYVAPFVAYLGHESNACSGGVFECGSGWVSAVRWQRTGGYGFPSKRVLTPEDIRDKWNVICEFNDGRSTHPTSAAESFQTIYANIANESNEENHSAKKSGYAKASGSSKVDVAKAQQATFAATELHYNDRDVILYNLGVGAKRTDLSLVYENHENFHPLPTFGIAQAVGSTLGSVNLGEYFPDFNPMMLLHGEQYIELKKPFPVSGTVKITPKIVDILDKGKGSVVIVGTTTHDDKGQELCYNESSLFIRGVGGWGGKKSTADRGAATAENPVPDRAPDAVVIEKTSEEQAALYRLSGDYNPLHIDPQMSAMGGFKVPILHGMCTLGIAAKHVYMRFGNTDPTKFKNVKARMAQPVYPGETLQTEMWKEGNKIIFQVRVKERNVVAVSNAALELQGISSAPASSGSHAGTSGGNAVSNVNVPGFKSSMVFVRLATSMSSQDASKRKEQVNKVKAVFQFDVKNDSGKTQTWYVDLKNGAGAIGLGAPPAGKPDATIALADNDFLDLAEGRLNGQKAFMQGKLKIKGQMMLATKLDSVLKEASGKSKL